MIGAGFSGIAATKKLAKTFKKDTDVSITLIDKHSYHTMMTELHEVAAGRVEPECIQFDLQRLFCRKKNVNLVTDTVTTIDKEKKIVKTKNGSYPFDYVIIGMGGETNDFGTKGVKENAFTLWSMEDAIRLRTHIADMVSQGAVETDPEKRKQLLTFVICGSGFTGVEMVGELNDWRKTLAKRNKISPDEINIYMVEAMPEIMNMLDRRDANKAEAYLVKKGVHILKEHKIVEVTEDAAIFSDGEQLSTSTLIWTAGVQGTSDAKAFDMEASDRGQRLYANEYMEAKGYEDKGIYVVGDLVFYSENGDGKPTPQIVQAAEQTAETAANNVIADIKKTEKHKFKSNYQGFMVSLGSTYGVACLMNKFHLSGFLAMLMKHFVNLIYFFSIRSGYYMVQYISHEFFNIKHKRNVFRGYLSRHGNVLWSVPLRIFYGSVWLVETMKKIVGNGELLHPGTWFGDGSWFTDKVVFPFEWLQNTEAMTGASGAEATTAASGAASTVADATTTFGLSYAYGENPMPVFEKMPDWFASIVKIFIPNQEVALFMQKMMTIVELLIALAIIFGLFTWLCNAATIALVGMFCLSGMFYWVNIWFVFVAFALMNGSGRTFGLDYYVIPWIEKKLGGWWYGKPRAIYSSKK